MEHTFFLKGVDVAKVLDLYNEGYYDNIEIDVSDKIDLKKNTTKTKKVIGTNNSHQCYEYKIGDVYKRIVVTGHEDFVVGYNNNKGSNGRCKWCNSQIKGYPLGIPLKWIYDPETGVSIFHLIKKFCHFECVLSYIVRENVNNKVNGFFYTNSETLLRNLFEMIHPGKVLRRARDSDLLDINDGPLTESEYFEDFHEYVPNGRIIFSPVKREFDQTDKKFVINV